MAPLEYRSLLEACDKKFKEHESGRTHFCRKDHLWTLYLHETGRFKLPENADKDTIYGGCNCGNCHLTILPNGDIYACRRFESKIGNIFKESLEEAWNSPEMMKYRDYGAFKKCGKCELLRFCRGCPAVAHGAGNGFYGPDPQCWKEIASFETLA
jgi:radical SAM protein with 4Fe4S-binding SPASM domain